MAKPNRKPLQVDAEFKNKLDELQRNIMKSEGRKTSFRELTEQIVKSPYFKDIEKTLLKEGKVNMDIKIKFDRRFL